MNRFINKIIQGDCLEVMKSIPDKSVDMVLTSPPYDNLRDYKGYVFEFENIAKQIFRIIKDGGVAVWVVGDSVVDGSETGTSFKQALYFKEIGFKLHDTMIYKKTGIPFPESTRYNQCFEYMFVFVKNKIKTFNPIKVKTQFHGLGTRKSTTRQADGSTDSMKYETNKNERLKFNVWEYSTGFGQTDDKHAFKHPAMFPEKLAKDHIISWSNENDIVLDPMCGSGTTCKMAIKTNRKFIGIELSQEYVDIARKRIADELKQLDFFRNEYFND